MAGRLATTTKDIGLLKQLYDDGQLQISAEFQRNAIWSRPAKAYLIDTVLTENPIPVLYFQKAVNAQTNRLEYTVVDGQQRLNSIFQFLENRFSLTQSDPAAPWYKKRWKGLAEEEQLRILSYDLVIQELSGYSGENVREMFRRMNRYVVALNPQERRHASEDGVFKRLVQEIGAWKFWTENGVITQQAAKRMKNDELVAELLILLNEGPQDKKESVDLYYESYVDDFPDSERLKKELDSLIVLIDRSVPDLKRSVLRRAANIYALVGALSEIREEGAKLPAARTLATRLTNFSNELAESSPSQRAAGYLVAQSRQTDNIRPRRARIDILRDVILKG